MKTTVACLSLALLLAACSRGEPAPPEAPTQAASAPSATPGAAPVRDAVVAAKAPAECAQRHNPRSGKLEPLQVVTGSGAVTFQVEIADNDAEREYGLMCRGPLAADHGMLFEFQGEENRAFWMHNTLIPLDIIFIGKNGRIVSIGRNARPLDDSPVPSGAPASGVLELAGGRAAEIGLLPGDEVKHRFFKP